MGEDVRAFRSVRYAQETPKRTFKAVFVNYDGVILGGFGQTEELASVEEEREIKHTCSGVVYIWMHFEQRISETCCQYSGTACWHETTHTENLPSMSKRVRALPCRYEKAEHLGIFDLLS